MPGVAALQLAPPVGEHGRAKVHGGHQRVRRFAAQGQGNIQRACGQVQGKTVPRACRAREHAAPVLVYAQAEQAVEKVIPAGDTAEHARHGRIVAGTAAGLRQGGGGCHSPPPASRGAPSARGAYCAMALTTTP